MDSEQRSFLYGEFVMNNNEAIHDIIDVIKNIKIDGWECKTIPENETISQRFCEIIRLIRVYGIRGDTMEDLVREELDKCYTNKVKLNISDGNPGFMQFTYEKLDENSVNCCVKQYE